MQSIELRNKNANKINFIFEPSKKIETYSTLFLSHPKKLRHIKPITPFSISGRYILKITFKDKFNQIVYNLQLFKIII